MGIFPVMVFCFVLFLSASAWDRVVFLSLTPPFFCCSLTKGLRDTFERPKQNVFSSLLHGFGRNKVVVLFARKSVKFWLLGSTYLFYYE